MTKETLEELAVFLREERIDLVKQAESLAGELPLFEWVGTRLQPTELLTEVFDSDEVQWLSIAWLGSFLSTVEDPQNYDVCDILQINGYLELKGNIPILPDCWDRFYTKKPFDIDLAMCRIVELPLTWARSSCVQTINWIEGGCNVPDALIDVNIVFHNKFSTFRFDRDRLDDWVIGHDLLEFLQKNKWINDQMMTSIWVFSGDTEYGQGNAGHYEVIYATGTQEVLHVSLSYITVPRINPPSFVSVDHSTHHVDVNPAEYVQIYLRDGFTPPVSRIPEYPHRLDKLRHLIPNPDQRSGAFVDHTQDAKEVYRQDVLVKLEELEQAIQAAKEQWRQW